jgi:Zn-finger nucleic acid-binding protein
MSSTIIRIQLTAAQASPIEKEAGQVEAAARRPSLGKMHRPPLRRRWSRAQPQEQEPLPMPLLMCPNCNEGMQEVRRNEVQIDVCPKCRGVWLDRGELEKLLHTAREVETDYERERESWGRQPAGYQPQHHRSGHEPHGQYRKKRKFSDMFDIFD